MDQYSVTVTVLTETQWDSVTDACDQVGAAVRYHLNEAGVAVIGPVLVMKLAPAPYSGPRLVE